jgi:hypothetical protein
VGLGALWEIAARPSRARHHSDFTFVCHHELRSGDALVCIRLDNGRRVNARVAWARSKDSRESEAGVEFIADEDFWGMEASLSAPVLPGPVKLRPQT